MTADERIEALEKRVDALELALRMFGGFLGEKRRMDEEMRRLKSEPAPAFPAALSREDAVFAVGAMLRPLLAAVPPAQRAEALAEGPPAHALETFASVIADAPQETRDGLADLARHAREHALTWNDLGVTP